VPTAIFSTRRGEGEPRSRRHCRDHGEAGRGAEAPSDGYFGAHADLPTDLGDTDKSAKVSRKSKARKQKEKSSRPDDKAAERKAALAYEREQNRRDREREREEAARQKERERRQHAVAKAQFAVPTMRCFGRVIYYPFCA
jgi:hypothetical protein